MAGIFGLFDYSKVGKGVDKNAPEKKRFFLFFELYFRKFWKLIALNFIYLLFCIPIVTIGPATSAMALVLKNYSLERPVFLFSDFFEAFKKNFKQSLVIGIIAVMLIALLATALQFYRYQLDQGFMYYIPLVMVLSSGFILLLMSFYIFLMIPVLDMKMIPMIKNAFYLSILGLKTNIITFLFLAILVVPMVLFFPITIIVAAVLFFSTAWFIIVFNSYPKIEKYIIEPYYEKTGEKRPDVYYFDEDDEFDDLIFEDIGTKEQPVAQPKTRGGRKTIR